MDDLVGLLKRELDEFMATYASLVLSTMGNDSVDIESLAEVERIGNMWSMIAKRNLSIAINTLIQWQTDRLDGSLFGHVGLWFAGQILSKMLQDQSLESSTLNDEISAKAVNTTFKILARWNSIECSAPSELAFFSFKGISSKPTNDFLLQRAVHSIWKVNLGLLGPFAIHHIKEHVLTDMENTSDMSKECSLNNYTAIRLHLIRPHTPFDEHAQAATSFLRVLTTCTHQANQPSVRVTALQVIGSILSQELSNLSKAGVKAYHEIRDADEWTKLLADLHSTARKFSAKNRYAEVAWQVRIATVMLSNAEFFTRTWKEDALALLDAFGRKKGSVPYLHLVEFMVKSLVRRHIASKRTVPHDKDMMEIINSVQAWCFTNSKHKFKKMRIIFSVLVKLTLCITAYNVEYGIQSHIQRLLLDSDSIFEVRQLVGLLSLQALFQQTGFLPTSEAIYIKIDRIAVATHIHLLGHALGQVLTFCSKNLDVPGRMTKTTEFKQWIGIQSFEAAVLCSSCLYEHLTLSSDQTLPILTHCAVHSEECLRIAAAATLCRIGVEKLEFAVFRSIGLYLLGVDTAQDAPILLDALESIVRDPNLSTLHGLDNELTTLEALCLFLMCQNSSKTRLKALSVLDGVRTLRITRLESSTINVMDIVTGIDGDLEKKLNLQENEKQLASDAGGIIQWLAGQPTTREWLWSLSMATLFPRVSEICPELIAQVWTCGLNALYQLETVVADPNSSEVLSHWRNLAILTCSAADITRIEATSSLLQRLSQFFRGYSVELQISVSVALSTTHFSSHLLLLDVLSSSAVDAFTIENSYESRQLDLHGTNIGALSRCYRSILEHRVHLWDNDKFRVHILEFLEKLLKVLIVGNSMSPSWLWWSRCEFCAITESVIHQNNMLSLEEDNEYIGKSIRELWFKATFAWCERISVVPSVKSTLASSLLPLNREVSIQWHQYTLTKAAYSTMAMLLIGPVFDIASCFTWIDTGFSMLHAPELRKIVASGLKMLLQSDPVAIIPKCIDRCFYTEVSDVAKQYLDVLATVAVELRDEILNTPSLCELIFVSLLHLEHIDNQGALHILCTLLDEELQTPDHEYTKTSTRQIQLVMHEVATRWNKKSIQVLELMISYVAKCKTNSLQGHVLSLCGPWIQECTSINRNLLTLLFRVTHEHTSLHSLGMIWLKIARSRRYTHLDTIIEYFTLLATKEKLKTARKILNWITPTASDTQQVLERLIGHVQRVTTFATSSLAVILLAGIASQLDDSFHVDIAHRAFSILYYNLQSKEKAQSEDLFCGLEDDCLALLEAMVRRDISGYDSIIDSLRQYAQGNDTETVSKFDTLLERFCLSMPNEMQTEWATKSTAYFSKSHFDAKFSLKLYRFLQPPFNGMVCVQVMGMLKETLDDTTASSFVSEYLSTLTIISASMPPSKLVLYPQLVWVAVALLNHTHESFHVPALQLLHEIVKKPNFLEPVVQDVLTARRPPTWKSKDAVTDILLAVSRHVALSECEEIVREVVLAVLTSKVATKSHSFICTAVLLPALCLPTIDATKSSSLRQDLGFLWRILQQRPIADSFLHNGDVSWKFNDILGRQIMAAFGGPEEEKVFFDVFLAILNRKTTALLDPTLDILKALVQNPPSSFWKRNDTLLAALTRILRETSPKHSNWSVLVAILSTLLPSP